MQQLLLTFTENWRAHPNVFHIKMAPLTAMVSWQFQSESRPIHFFFSLIN